MSEKEALEYARTKLDYFAEDAELTCKEIGDGNLNYIFRIVDEKYNKSIIIKQAGPVARISDEFKVSPDRNRIESDILKLHYKLAPDYAPITYEYDPIMNCFAMEDLSDYEIMRAALMKYKEFPLFADQITTFIVNTLIHTSDVVMEHKEKKELVKKFINPELCEISEDLVYTEPFYDCPRNEVFDPSRSFIEEHIWNDKQLQLETAKLKFEFMTNAQSLIHGDLHTGSIFIKEDTLKVIDPEFAFYGPIGYDVGNVIANLILAYVHARFTIEDETERNSYVNYLKKTIREVVNLFKDKFNQAFDRYATEQVTAYEGFKSYYLESILKDTAAVAGLELCRRIIGLAQVVDITSIEDSEKRANAEKICLLSGKKFILERDTLTTGEGYVNVIEAFEKETLEV
ncbi:S-methyl-5-thioribose kinase [Pseudogracilibacillus sp. SE30717A]|uniref:S-methyl-5-thioribose kinase n=1 Tax=Pseudogracilibacillus sp. SE30717A TaxID=3098293 RepID=UPI003FA7BEE8